jgi:hypothetical protein
MWRQSDRWSQVCSGAASPAIPALLWSTSLAADPSEVEHNAPHVWSQVLGVETEFGAHLQHVRVFE